MEKKITLINKENHVIIRTTRSQAEKEFLPTGKFTFTTKGKLKSFINREVKLHHNSKALKGIDFESKNSRNKIIDDQFTGKRYAAIYKGMRARDVVPDETKINPLTGKPFSQVVYDPLVELRVISWPE